MVNMQVPNDTIQNEETIKLKHGLEETDQTDCDAGEKEEGESEEKTWTNKMDFIMAAISSAIGFGNLWRFPYQCYKNGGGAFLIPFLIMVVLAGFPQVLADIALGQYSRSGCVRAYRAVPLLIGVGWLLVLLSFHVDVYYVVVVSWTLFYMFASFTSKLPWVSCGNWWNTENCVDASTALMRINCTLNNGSWVNAACLTAVNLSNYTTHNGDTSIQNLTRPALLTAKSKDASEEYFNNYVLQLSTGITDIGLPRWPILLCVLLTWLVVFGALLFGPKTWGKMAYVFALIPYIVMTALLIQSLLKEGSVDGILYLLTPKWIELTKPQVWVDAVGQAFFSLGSAGGILITIGSMNKFKNNCFMDTIIVTIGDTLTSLLCGIVVFSILGLMAHELDTSIDEVIGKGAGMTFVVYSAALAKLPQAPVWAVVFMLMIFCLGAGTIVSFVATSHKAFFEVLPDQLQQKRAYHTLVLLFVIFLYFVIGLVYTTNGGMYVLQMMDGNVAYIMLIVGLIKAITIAWIYGIDNLYNDIEVMSGYRPSMILGWMHKVITPGILMFVLVFNFTQMSPLQYGDYIFPVWAEAVGWCLTFITLIVIPAIAIYKVASLPGDMNIANKLRFLCQPETDWRDIEKKDKLGQGTKPHTGPDASILL